MEPFTHTRLATRITDRVPASVPQSMTSEETGLCGVEKHLRVLKDQIAELLQLIMDPNMSAKELTVANIQLEVRPLFIYLVALPTKSFLYYIMLMCCAEVGATIRTDSAVSCRSQQIVSLALHAQCR